ncbi:hypothetical protein HII31_09324 [Pseudocercospora fuligena]|uniref:Uncharacterized protein n=1 Tax=Pseudocercospora fuligena TaxID=685502 RepID=A0A8H6RB45_9PEZI|nr:hypothetical protein HII31_09324 [Pseudocercospora fuligena]
MVNYTIFLSTIVALVAIFAAYIYIFGLPPELKRELEKKALRTMGENKASYMMQEQIKKVPDSDQQDVKDLKKGLGNLGGGALKNPLGEAVGEAGDEGTRPMTGR